MNKDVTNKRAAITRNYLDNRIAWQDFMDKTVEFEGDELVNELIDIIEHEPKKGGFRGLSETEWKKRQQSINDILAQLEL